MKRHALAHSGVKTFMCAFEGCDYATTESSHLKRHQLRHTGEKCVFAPRAARDACTAVAVLPRRGTSTRVPAALASAARPPRSPPRDPAPPSAPTPRRPYKCAEPDCDYAATESTTLRKHLEKVHQIAPPPRAPKAADADDAPKRSKKKAKLAPVDKVDQTFFDI